MGHPVHLERHEGVARRPSFESRSGDGIYPRLRPPPQQIAQHDRTENDAEHAEQSAVDGGVTPGPAFHHGSIEA